MVRLVLYLSPAKLELLVINDKFYHGKLNIKCLKQV